MRSSPRIAQLRADAAREFTDDAGIAEWFGLDVALVEGAEDNRKLTTAEDLRMADELLETGRRAPQRHDPRGHRAMTCMPSAPGDAVMLVRRHASRIGKKLIGHSDADVGLHALTDALLGTIAEGDIGVHFPPSDARWRGVASEVFLKHAASLVRRARRGDRACRHHAALRSAAHRAVSRSDALAHRRDARLSRSAQVSIKATTNEGLGFIGSGEGIAAMATATVSLP